MLIFLICSVCLFGLFLLPQAPNPRSSYVRGYKVMDKENIYIYLIHIAILIIIDYVQYIM